MVTEPTDYTRIEGLTITVSVRPKSTEDWASGNYHLVVTPSTFKEMRHLTGDNLRALVNALLADDGQFKAMTSDLEDGE